MNNVTSLEIDLLLSTVFTLEGYLIFIQKKNIEFVEPCFSSVFLDITWEESDELRKPIAHV
jgi:hypothetical protein